MRVLILYTELAGYVLGNINRFLNTHSGSRVMLIHYPVNPEAPFVFNIPEGSEFLVYKKENEENIRNRIKAFDPETVLCSGWSNAYYLDLIKHLPKGVKKVVCFDNHWKGSLKQYVLRILSPFYLLRLFRYAWVPGQPQKEYALKLGFKPSDVFTGLYPADTDLFSAIGQKKLKRSGPYPKIIISVARYIPQKDLPTLWRAFINANRKTGMQWQLKCFGLGEQFEQRIEDPYISHLGFKQPQEMESLILDAGIFVLPSIEEPWGVAVHEMALSALPLVLSNKVGAASMFLNKDNGFMFEAGNAEQLESVLEKMMLMSDDELRKMASASYCNGRQLLSDDWYGTLLKISLS